LLTLSLLVLMRTRWGQARPLSKCVVLSVLAHLWLLAYAHMTKLWDEPMRGQPDRAVQVQVIIDPDEQTTAPQPEQPKTWQKLPQSHVVDPTSVDLTRRELAESDDRPQPLASDTAFDVPPPVDVSPAPEPEPTERVPTPVTPRQPIAALVAPPLVAQPRVESDLPQPQQPQLEPVAPRDIEVAATTSQPADTHPSIEPDEARVQRLADAANAQDEASALADRYDELARADRSAQDRTPIAPQPAPADASTPAPPPPVAAVSNHQSRQASQLLSGQPLPQIYQARVAADRLREAQRRGGSAETEAAVERALAWLASCQSADGRWDANLLQAGRETNTLGHNRNRAGANADTGISALALLAFLGAGQTHVEGPHREIVQRGLEFVVGKQRHDGFLGGNAQMFAAMYCHGIATLAISEAYAMTGDQRLQPYVERAIQFTIRSQHPGSGGWRYLPQEQGDTSQFGWQLMALTSAEKAGLQIPPNCRLGMHRFLRSVSSGQHGGLAAYRAVERPSRTMTAEALACRMFLGADALDPAVNEAADFVINQPPADGQANLYYWYYGTLALYHLQDDRWARWNAALKRRLLRSQQSGGTLDGSWDPNTVWGGYGGRVYSTALAALCLEVYYRYLPLYETDRTASRPR
jgi:hypothetical protein